MKKNLSIRSLNLLYSALCLPVWWFQMPFEGLSFVISLATFGILYPLDPFLQNVTYGKIWIRSCFQLAIYPCAPGHSFPRASSLKRSSWPPFCISNTINSFSDCSKDLEKSISTGKFGANVLKVAKVWFQVICSDWQNCFCNTTSNLIGNLTPEKQFGRT